MMRVIWTPISPSKACAVLYLMLFIGTIAQITPEAQELFERARAAHGGEALQQLISYQEIGVITGYDLTGAPAQETSFRTLVDLRGQRLRTELLQHDELILIQQLTADGAFVWMPQIGDMPLPDEQANDLQATLELGIYALQRGLADAEHATALGAQEILGVSGQAVAVTRGNRTVTFLFGDDGRLLAERYTLSQFGEVTNIYRDYATVAGIVLPIAYDGYAQDIRLLSTRIASFDINPPLTDDDFILTHPSATSEVSPAALAWLREWVQPFSSIDPGADPEDLAAFADIVGNARIVALGEQTHGTSEFFRMKHRLLEYLVRNKGFTLFAIEANMPEAERLNRYVLTGEGDPKALLEGLYFWTWNTREVFELIEWMREYNRTSVQPVQFVGFDMQYAELAIDNLRSFLAAVDPDYLRSITPTLEAVQDGSLTGLQQAVDAISTHLAAQYETYSARSTAAALDWAVQNARIVAQAIAFQQGNQLWRDAAMADNVRWILKRHPDAKMVIWAHNGHIAKKDGWMGGHLRDTFSKDYLAVGFSFYEGKYRARSWGGDVATHVAEPAPDGSLDALLNQIGPEQFLLDLRNTASSPAAPWLTEERFMRSIGAIALPGITGFAPTVAADDFDALIFIRTSTASEALQ
jgi:erythromycin esterase